MFGMAATASGIQHFEKCKQLLDYQKKYLSLTTHDDEKSKFYLNVVYFFTLLKKQTSLSAKVVIFPAQGSNVCRSIVE
jgi:hypothetical protein